MNPARYIMVGGFLGAGKTTALLQLAKRFRQQGQRVGLITNDQSVGLVDTAMLAAHNLPVQEITGGCFCCRFTSLTQAAEHLSHDQQPEIFLAEPVGSCTDLTATVSYPLRRMYGDAYEIAPYSVLIDPIRAERILGLAPGKTFSDKVIYIYLKQLEEAELLVINKLDTIDESRFHRLRNALQSRFPQGEVLGISARHGTHIDTWIDRLTAGSLGNSPAMAIDYDTYAEGEALLGWVNLSAELTQAGDFDGNQFLQLLIECIHQRLENAQAQIAHLKITLSPDTGIDLGVVNLVRGDAHPELSHELQEPLTAGELILNLRAEADPKLLETEVHQALRETAARFAIEATIHHSEAFRPGRPVPTHRLAQA
jgi:Ni2+-binding GTPase involved in maturation of urease and hydrogenase